MLIPARCARRRTMRAAPSRFKKIGPVARLPMYRSNARAVLGARGMVAVVWPFAVDEQGPGTLPTNQLPPIENDSRQDLRSGDVPAGETTVPKT